MGTMAPQKWNLKGLETSGATAYGPTAMEASEHSTEILNDNVVKV